jgi:hypothetical protein
MSVPNGASRDAERPLGLKPCLPRCVGIAHALARMPASERASCDIAVRLPPSRAFVNPPHCDIAKEDLTVLRSQL